MNEHQLSAEEVVLKLRTECFEKTGLTVSAGIAPTKVSLASSFPPVLQPSIRLLTLLSPRQMLAKICSDRLARSLPSKYPNPDLIVHLLFDQTEAQRSIHVSL
jgi:hypothetical protein